MQDKYIFKSTEKKLSLFKTITKRKLKIKILM